jgi:hypothetical protein
VVLEKSGDELRVQSVEVRVIQAALDFSARPVEVPSADSQCGKILRHIQEFGSITTFEAYAAYGITTCGQRCTDLRKLGWPVYSTMVEVKPGTRAARYRLGE